MYYKNTLITGVPLKRNVESLEMRRQCGYLIKVVVLISRLNKLLQLVPRYTKMKRLIFILYLTLDHV